TRLAVVAAMVCAAVTVLPAAASASPSSATVYVSTQGDDHADGSARHPVRSLARAQQLARAASRTGRDVTVYLAGGTYRPDQPLRFDQRDSGAPGHEVRYVALPGAHPVVSGGTPVTGWQLADAGKGIWKAYVGRGRDSRQLIVDGRLATRARTQISR